MRHAKATQGTPDAANRTRGNRHRCFRNALWPSASLSPAYHLVLGAQGPLGAAPPKPSPCQTSGMFLLQTATPTIADFWKRQDPQVQSWQLRGTSSSSVAKAEAPTWTAEFSLQAAWQPWVVFLLFAPASLVAACTLGFREEVPRDIDFRKRSVQGQSVVRGCPSCTLWCDKPEGLPCQVSWQVVCLATQGTPDFKQDESD